MAIIQLLQEPLESRGLELVELGRMLRQPQWRWHCAIAPCRCDAEGHAWRPKKARLRRLTWDSVLHTLSGPDLESVQSKPKGLVAAPCAWNYVCVYM